jgi:hypothetical protein
VYVLRNNKSTRNFGEQRQRADASDGVALSDKRLCRLSETLTPPFNSLWRGGRKYFGGESFVARAAFWKERGRRQTARFLVSRRTFASFAKISL